ncbi:hypothetical protein PHYBOEH_001504 [Phytophthora boehmeriae]|uniref:Uncharacterized protein n=1 Tax=Phytophthora boehmeriae TaxID=109152 RepID=A0A8T1WSY6_9STRA|nr:hypothetical protein PHYBOEH_001504 [Phytophthora boehmeriae]
MTSVMPMPTELSELPAKTLDNVKSPVDPEELQRAVRRVGSALRAVLGLADISSGCRAAVERMEDLGEALELHFVEEIQSTGVLAHCAAMEDESLQHMAIGQLVELRDAVAACATVTMNSIPVAELMALWSVVHESVSDVLTEEAVALAGKLKDFPQLLEAVEDVGAEAMAIGKVLTAALDSSAVLASSASDELREAIQNLAEAGKPVAEHLAAELRSQLPAIRDALSAQEWTELRSRCSQSITTEWRALGEAAEKVASRTADAVELVKLTTSDVFNSPFAKVIAAQGLIGLDGVLGQSRDAVDATLDALRDGGIGAVGAIASCLARSGLPPLLRVEIARDFFQTAGLFFSGLYGAAVEFLERQNVANGIRRLISGLRSAYDVMAVNVLALVKAGSQNRALLIDIALGALLAAIGVIYASFLWFAFFGRRLHRRSDEVRQGHEATTWAALATKQKMRVKLFTLVITACLTIYLPLTRLCLDVLMTASTRTSDTDDGSRAISASDLVVTRFKDDKAWPAIVVAAIVLLATFTLPLPWLLINVISENRPTGSLENPLVTYDLDGEEVPFDDKVYARLVARDPSQLRCPYRSLYAGFEQRWRYYKIFQLLVKLALVLVVVVAASADARIRGVLTCVIYAGVVALSSYGTPFSDPLNNVMEISGKITAFATCISGALAAFVDIQHSRSQVLETVAAVVSVLHIVNLFVMASVLLLGMRGTRLFLKNMLGWLTFSDTSRGLADAPAKHVLPGWSIDKEVKHRVWQAFWRSVMLDLSQNDKGYADELTVAHRLDELEQAVVASGVRRVRSHWRGEDNPYTAKLRQAICATLEGVDVYWNDAGGARDGHLDSKSCFGKMYVRPYPFHCIMVYDDSKDEAIVRDDDDSCSRQPKLAKLLFLNFTPQMVAKRALRQKLRVLSTSATSVHFPFSREEKATVEDGTVTKTDSEGNTRTETRYSTVSFTCYYTRGVIHVATKGDATKRIMAEGFDVSMTYRDGYGDAVAPHTRKVHHLENRVAEMGPDHIGLTPMMEESEQLRAIFEQTRQVWEIGVQGLQTHYQDYRRSLAHKHSTANATLSDAFWYFVYNDPNLSRDDLEKHLRNREGNSRLYSLAETHRDALDSLYLRMRYIQSHPAIAFWFVFWDDIYARNGEMKRLRKFTKDFDPREPTAICYNVMQRHALENWLKERRLFGTRYFFHPRLLDLLYKEMDKRLKKSM